MRVRHFALVHCWPWRLARNSSRARLEMFQNEARKKQSWRLVALTSAEFFVLFRLLYETGDISNITDQFRGCIGLSAIREIGTFLFSLLTFSCDSARLLWKIQKRRGGHFCVKRPTCITRGYVMTINWGWTSVVMNRREFLMSQWCVSPKTVDVKNFRVKTIAIPTFRWTFGNEFSKSPSRCVGRQRHPAE